MLSAAWRSGLDRRFYDDYDQKVIGSIINLVALRPWIMDKMLYDDYLCLVESGKQQINSYYPKTFKNQEFFLKFCVAVNFYIV